MTGIIELTTTLETEEQAAQLAELLVTSRLAACVQITGPIVSVYRWQGQTCKASEYRCTAKSIGQLAGKLIQTVTDHHPYTVPEILITDVADCSEPYADWLRAQIHPEGDT